MALVTRCPKCSTMFRVVPDQLRVSAGWVRCGHCSEVFDAAQHMLPRNSEVAALEEMQAREKRDAPEAPSSAQGALTNSAGLLQRREGEPKSAGLPVPESGAEDALPSLPPLPSVPPPAPPQPPRQQRAKGAPDSAFMADLRAASAAVTPDESMLPPPPLPGELMATPKPSPAPAVSQGSAGGAPPPESVDLLLSELGEEIDESAMAPSFVQRARRRRQPTSPHMRALFWFVLAALALTLVLQMLISERNWLAARQPALAPALRGLCGVFNCSVGPYQHIDAIVIDNSGFSRAADGSFLFHYTLRNQAGLPVATPALELTLTDAHERPLVRRVVTVRELGAPVSIPARGEYSGARTLRLSTTANPSAVTGYKLVAFYP
ncbi:MAG: zinc-ribbon domain-containing protein [Ottowia sp.]|nr:zinc-ribbon domain-containing protein [Ottowia sp.]